MLTDCLSSSHQYFIEYPWTQPFMIAATVFWYFSHTGHHGSLSSNVTTFHHYKPQDHSAAAVKKMRGHNNEKSTSLHW